MSTGMFVICAIVVVILISILIAERDSNNKNEVSAETSSDNNEVIITDIKMKFSSMVMFMVKWVIASIPAFIILFLIWMIAMGAFGVGIATLFN